MPKREAAPDVEFSRAALQVEATLREALGFAPERLDPSAVTAAYPTRRYVRGWRIAVEFAGGAERRIDLLLGPGFPAGYPRTALVDRPDHMTWPHIEHDGILCLLPTMAEVDAEDPGAVASNLLGRSVRLVEELIEGKIVDRDFREEYLTYWFYGSDGDAPRVYSLVRPGPPSRPIRLWREGDGLVIVADDDDDEFQRWLRNFRGEPKRKSFPTEAAAFLWLSQAPVPSEYPVSGADLAAVAERAEGDAASVLIETAAALPEDVLVLIGAEGRGGPGLVAVTTTSGRRNRSRSGRIERPLTKGFRGSAMPADVAAARTYGAARLLRSNVQRADAEWIHGRGKDQRTALLLKRTVTIIGCGSVGSSVAARLARAGVGRLRLYDHERLAWPNVGRHELGAWSIAENKADELAKRLSADFPHLDIQGEAIGAQSLIKTYSERLRSSDLVVSTTGSWQAEGALNRWHVDEGRPVPFLYGWTESHAAAGHAVVIAGSPGCLRCGIGRTGVPAFRATEWGETGATLEEPACGNHFQPYGAVELGFIVDLIADAALETLLDWPQGNRHVLWLTRTDRLKASGGTWSGAVLERYGDEFEGGLWTTRGWPTSDDCPVCGTSTVATP